MPSGTLFQGSVLHRSKRLGGGLVTNFMQYMRGNPEDYNECARETRYADWSYENLLPFFKKMENYYALTIPQW